MLMINWPLVLLTTAILYVLTIVTLPFNSVYATVFLFSIIAFWSRLPGVGIPHPLFILYNTDVVDLFALLFTINIGPHAGIALVIFGNIWSRFCGVHPEWGAVLSDTGSLSVACLVAPFLNNIFEGDILVTMIAFTVVRWIMWQPMDLIFWPQVWANIMHKISLTLIGFPVIILINGFYAKLFGDFFSNLLKAGVVFNWMLFFFVTAVIIIFYGSVFGFSKFQTKAVRKTVKHVIKKAIPAKSAKNAHDDSKELDEMRRIRDQIS